MGNHTILLQENKDNLMFMHRGLVGIQHTLLIFGDFGAFGLKFFAAFLTDGIGQLGAGMCWCEVTFEFHPNMEDGKRCNNEMLCTYTAYIYIYIHVYTYNVIST